MLILIPQDMHRETLVEEYKKVVLKIGLTLAMTKSTKTNSPEDAHNESILRAEILRRLALAD